MFQLWWNGCWRTLQIRTSHHLMAKTYEGVMFYHFIRKKNLWKVVISRDLWMFEKRICIKFLWINLGWKWWKRKGTSRLRYWFIKCLILPSYIWNLLPLSYSCMSGRDRIHCGTIVGKLEGDSKDRHSKMSSVHDINTTNVYPPLCVKTSF